jgi:hypothetical protein
LLSAGLRECGALNSNDPIVEYTLCPEQEIRLGLRCGPHKLFGHGFEIVLRIVLCRNIMRVMTVLGAGLVPFNPLPVIGTADEARPERILTRRIDRD